MASALALDSVRPAGALHVVGGGTVVVASSFAQARLTFEAVKNSLELLGEDGEYRIRDQQNLADIQHRETKARLRVAGADNRRAHGWRFNLAICDEPSQWGPRSELLAAAIRTALGKRRDARAIFIGTRLASDAHFFARLLEEDDPSVFSLVYAADADDSPFAVKTWRKANPGMRYGMPNIEVLRAEARLAKRDPAELASFRSLRLRPPPLCPGDRIPAAVTSMLKRFSPSLPAYSLPRSLPHVCHPPPVQPLPAGPGQSC